MKEEIEPPRGEAEQETPRRRFDFRWGATIIIGLVICLFVAVVITRSADPCTRWERQLNELTRGLTKHRLARGNARPVAISVLEELNLPCAKVASVREDCVAAYRALLVAESRQNEAKAVIARLRKAVNGLSEPQREIARRRFLENQSLTDIGRDLQIEDVLARQRLDAAVKAIGPGQLAALDSEFETAVNRSQEQLRSAADHNFACDAALKRLVEEAQAH